MLGGQPSTQAISQVEEEVVKRGARRLPVADDLLLCQPLFVPYFTDKALYHVCLHKQGKPAL